MTLSLNPSDRATVERQLSGTEHVEWIGRPDPSRHLTRGDLFLVPFSVLWTAFTIVWESTVIAEGRDAFFALWGIPFVLLGVYMVIGRFFYKAYRARRTLYAVTNRRVIVVMRRARGETVEATYLRAIPSISTRAESRGHGTVAFGTVSAAGGWYGNTGMELLARGSAGNVGVSFYDIDDPRAVADLVERLREHDRS